MPLLPRCEKHGHHLPCPECIIYDGWLLHEQSALVAARKEHQEKPKGTPPTHIFRKAMDMFHGLLAPLDLPPAPEPVVWKQQDAGGAWMAEIGAARLVLFPVQNGYSWKIDMGNATHRSSTDILPLDEAKAVVVREATAILTGMLISLATISG